MLDKAKAPAEVLQDQGRGETAVMNTQESTPRKPKRKLGSVWFEGGRYLYRYGANGVTVFDIWKWTGKSLPRRTHDHHPQNQRFCLARSQPPSRTPRQASAHA